MRCKPLLFLSFLVLTKVIFGQDYRILHWGVEDGLSQGINQKIIRDSEGFLWATSYEGVNRFDGKIFRNFYAFPKKRHSIRGVETVGLVEDSLHNIWIGSGDGLNRYDPVADSVTTFLLSDRKDPVQYIIPLAATGEETICFDYTGKIVGYHSKTLKTRVITSGIQWHDDYVYATNCWLDKKSNTLWMPAKNGLAEIAITTGKTTFYFPQEQVNAVAMENKTGILFLATDNGLIAWDTKQHGQKPIFNLLATPLGKVTSLAIDAATNLWIGTEEYGLFIMDEKEHVTRIKKTADEQHSINGNKINSIYCDNTGIVWVGVGTNGIDQLIPGNRFMHYSETARPSGGLSNNIVRCFIEDKKQNVWIATQGGGINVYHPADRSFSYLTQKELPGLPFDHVRFMVKDENVAWIGTEKGMCRVDMGSLKTERIHFIHADKRKLPDPYIEQIIHFTDSSWLIATKAWGLFELDKRSSEAKQLLFPGDKHVFYTALVNERLFVSVWDEDQKIFDLTKSTWKEIKKDINTFLITFVLYDAKRKKHWIGTLKGLLETDADLNIIRQYTTDDGLSNNYVYALLQDQEGMLWITTNRGLSQFNPDTHTFSRYAPSDGLQGYEYNAKAGFMSADGTLYFGGTNGFDVVKKRVVSPLFDPPRFYMSELLVNNIPFTGNKNINYTAAISLPYQGNNITIQTAVIDFAAKGKNTIRYKLAGIDTGWKMADRDFSINYSGLSPGSYKFVAGAANDNNQWNDNTSSLTIVIANPWWQTWWWRAALIVICCGILALIIRYYYARKWQKQRTLLEKQKAVEHERTRIATDMHDDLGAGLSRIKFLSETMELKNNAGDTIEKDIGKIRLYAHEMIEKMGEIVWALNEKNDSLQDLIAYTRSYTVEYLTQNNIQCAASVTENLPERLLNGEYRRNIFLSVKEALHNIVKHAKAKRVELVIEITDTLRIKISDDGIGFTRDKRNPSGNGLYNIQKRMTAINGIMEMREENGTIMELSAPLPA